MADNVTLNAGSGGSSLATDDVTDAGGAHYQRVKLTDGTANSETHIQAGNGTSANALRVTVSSDTTGVLSVDDNGDSLTVDGTVTANAGSGTFTVDGSGVTQPVSNAGLTELAAAINASSQMDVNIAASAATVTVDGSGVTQPVSGTVTANLSATDNAVLDTIASNTTGLSGAVSGSELQVDVVAALPAGTNAIGKLAANSGVDIGDVDVTSISAGTNLIGDVGISGARTSGGTTLYRNVDADESEDQVKGTAGQIYWIHAMNLTAAVLYLQVYNATAASVTVGTTTPDLTFPLATQGDTNGAGFMLTVPNGIAFGTAITIACTTTIGGASGPAANGCVVNLGYA